MLSAEIDCEHGELLMLAELAGLPVSQPQPRAGIMASNLTAFVHEWSIEPDEQDRLALNAILAAAQAMCGMGTAASQQPMT